MNSQAIRKISKSVYKQFPEVKGNQPRVEQNPKVQAKSINGPQTFVLTFTGVASDPKGRKIPRRVRVIASENGKILRISTTR